MSANWEELRAPFVKENVERSVEARAGVYRISQRADDGKYYAFYVGQAQDMRARLLQHLSPSEENACVRNRVSRGNCGFRVAYIATQGERDAEERTSIAEYNPDCNKQRL